MVRIRLEKEGRIGAALTLYGLRHTVAVILRESGCDEQVFVCAPCQNFGGSLDGNVGVQRNTTSDVFIELCRPNSKKSHSYDQKQGFD